MTNTEWNMAVHARRRLMVTRIVCACWAVVGILVVVGVGKLMGGMWK